MENETNVHYLSLSLGANCDFCNAETDSMERDAWRTIDYKVYMCPNCSETVTNAEIGLKLAEYTSSVDIDIAHDLTAMAVALRDRAPDDATPEEELEYDERIGNAMDEANKACDVAGMSRVFDELDYP